MEITDYEVVLADSTIVNTNANENTDLFWALKGGGRNFATNSAMSSLPSTNVYNAIQKALNTQTSTPQGLGLDLETISLTAVPQPMPSRAMKRSADTPPGLEPTSQQWFLAVADWKIPEEEEAARATVKYIVDVAKEPAKKKGMFLDYKYMNYAARDQDVFGGYRVDKVKRLNAVRRVYNP
ncbi:hypothetical protein BJX99DRAFT_264125 [Aspergillus californicus]